MESNLQKIVTDKRNNIINRNKRENDMYISEDIYDGNQLSKDVLTHNMKK